MAIMKDSGVQCTQPEKIFAGDTSPSTWIWIIESEIKDSLEFTAEIEEINREIRRRRRN